jgi:hypothetical protein
MEVWCRITVRGEGAPDITMVDGLARLLLAAGRAGGSVDLDDVSAGLAEILDLVGLGGQMCRQAELRKELGGVEERVESDDPPG